jgi:hypothetical protein
MTSKLSQGGLFPVVKRRWQLCAGIAFIAAIGAAVVLAQACGSGSAGEHVAPTPTNSPTSAAGGGAGGIPDITPGAGFPGRGLFVGGASEEFAAFLGISLEQLQSELSAEGATPGSVAEAHGRTREELKTFFTEQTQAQFSEAVAAGTMSQEAADNMIEGLASRIDDIIDGNVPSGMPGSPPDGQ